ncbi:MAG: AAA family ATPase [Pseudonocardiales bacterium]
MPTGFTRVFSSPYLDAEKKAGCGVLEGVFVGRAKELQRLRDLVVAVADGVGASVLIEGESGIGKSALLAQGLAEAERLGCALRWSAAEEWGHRFPLQVLIECLGFDARVPDPSLAEGADPVLAAMERALALVDHLCSDSPLVLVIDDLQWADDASMLVWERLSRVIDQLPLLLVGACRPTPRPDSLVRLRRDIEAGRGTVLDLGPLDSEQAADLITGLLGRPPGPDLHELAAQAGGNPLYLTELADALLRDGPCAGGRAPESLAAAIADRLGFLSTETGQMLRLAALLGREFAVADLSIVANRAPSELIAVMDEAVAARVVVPAGARYAFRHPVIRQALYEATPTGMRVALHGQIARALADSGASVDRVAEQMLPAAETADEWMFDWLVEAAPVLIHLAPEIAMQLFDAVAGSHIGTDEGRDVLASWLTIGLLRAGRNEESEALARQVLGRTKDGDQIGVMTWALGGALLRSGRADEAIKALRETLASEALPHRWWARLTALLAQCHMVRGEAEVARAAADEVLDAAEQDDLAAAYALHTVAAERASHLDVSGFVENLERGLALLRDDNPEHTDLRLLMLSHRIHALDAGDLFAAAEDTIRQARNLVDRVGRVRFAQVTVSIATHYFTCGQWDDALAELEATDDLEPGDPSFLVHHGLKALMAAHRNDRPAATLHLDTVYENDALTPANSWTLWNSAYVILARAVVAEQAHQPHAAVAELTATLGANFIRGNGRSLCLPALVRAALAVGDTATAGDAAAMCLADAQAAPFPAMQAGADQCRGLLERDPAALVAAADYYRCVQRPLELAQTLEELAVLLGEGGDLGRARPVFIEAIDTYAALGAEWDIRRVDARTRPLGMRRHRPRVAGRPTSGWGSLSPTELKTAELVAKGLSNPDIAAELFLSRRTVQTHVSHILAKLDARSRSEIAREAADHAPEDLGSAT